MSIRMMTKVWDETPFVQTTLLLMLCLADHADDKGVCWPSVTRLAERARCSERWARDRLAELETQGYVKRTMRSGKTTKYQLLFPEQGQLTPEPQIPPDESSPLNPSSPPTPEPQLLPPRNPSSGDPGTPVPMNHQEPPINHQDGVAVNHRGVKDSRRTGWQPTDRALQSAREANSVMDIPIHITRYKVVKAEKGEECNSAEWLRWYLADAQKAITEERRQSQESVGLPAWCNVAE